MANEETLYCVCRRPYEEEQFMIECDICKDWFHGSCVGIQEHQAADIETYHCPNCQVEHGPLVLKKRRNFHRRDYSETDDKVMKAVQTGTVLFIQELKKRSFVSADQIPLHRLKGHEVCVEFLEEQGGFTTPILVDRTDGLDLKLPPASFTIQDVENHVGSMREIDVIDVAKQEDYKMLMREWTEYYNSPNRTKIFNVISLEFSHTKLADLVDPPRIVKELSWVSNFWPSELPPDEEPLFQRPEVQRYCLMGVKDSFTDFHIDFGGTSVWYHVLRGEKVFYLIRPTEANLALYEQWVCSSHQSEMFFGDQVDVCYKIVIRQGQTFFIPTGWIHAVLTPIDSLVFGGNFLHSFNIPQQIQVYEIEKRCETSAKYMFPNYETLHWYAAKYILDQLHDFNEEGKTAPEYLVTGAKALAVALESWTQKKDLNNRHVHIKKENIPETIQYGRLLKELNKELKHMSGSPIKSDAKKNVKKEKKEKKGKSKKSMKKKGKEEEEEGGGLKKDPGPIKPGTQVGRPSLDAHPSDASEFKFKISGRAVQKSEFAGDSDEEDGRLSSDLKADPLKVTLKVKGLASQSSVLHDNECAVPHEYCDVEKRKLLFKSEKTDAAKAETDPSVYDFPDSDHEDGGSMKPKEEPSTADDGSKLKLKVSGGKIISNLKNTAISPVRGHFHLLGSTEAPSNVQVKSDDDDDEAGGLIVDEFPRKSSRPPQQPLSPSAVKPGSLRMKLSMGRGEGRLSPRLSPGADSLGQHSYAQRASMPTIRGGLNGSIADILEASGYGTETDFKIDEGRASPNMRDAIGGLLSMSRMAPSKSTASPLLSTAERAKASQRPSSKKAVYAKDERMPTCFKDEEYVYPTLDVSDAEDDHVFKPRGRLKKDETWNPKAKLAPNCPKPERPSRDNARRESVESGLAAAAAKLADKPRPKRQYIRKKPRQERRPSLLSTETPGSSKDLDLGPSGSKRPGGPPSSPIKSKKPKKGMATAKQRLGKILKIHKMVF